VANLEIKGYEIAKRYGGVLFDLAQEKKQVKATLKEIILFQKLLEKDLGQFLPHGQKQIIAVLKQEIIKLLQK